MGKIVAGKGILVKEEGSIVTISLAPSLLSRIIRRICELLHLTTK